jgi:hypothetical protein
MGARVWPDPWRFGDVLWHGDGDAPAIAVRKSRHFCLKTGSMLVSEFVNDESNQPIIFSSNQYSSLVGRRPVAKQRCARFSSLFVVDHKNAGDVRRAAFPCRKYMVTEIHGGFCFAIDLTWSSRRSATGVAAQRWRRCPGNQWASALIALIFLFHELFRNRSRSAMRQALKALIALNFLIVGLYAYLVFKYFNNLD